MLGGSVRLVRAGAAGGGGGVTTSRLMNAISVVAGTGKTPGANSGMAINAATTTRCVTIEIGTTYARRRSVRTGVSMM